MPAITRLPCLRHVLDHEMLALVMWAAVQNSRVLLLQSGHAADEMGARFQLCTSAPAGSVGGIVGLPCS